MGVSKTVGARPSGRRLGVGWAVVGRLVGGLSEPSQRPFAPLCAPIGMAVAGCSPVGLVGLWGLLWGFRGGDSTAPHRTAPPRGESASAISSAGAGWQGGRPWRHGGRAGRGQGAEVGFAPLAG